MCGSGQVMGANGGGVSQYGVPAQFASYNAATATQTVAQKSAVEAGGHSHVAGASGGHGAHIEPKIPNKNSPVIQKYLADGSYGPTVKKGKAKTIKIADGKGFGDVKGRKQNDGDKKQNNYSVTDANFYPGLGVLNDAKTGKPMNYVKQIQAYNAAGYISAFHPEVYAKMVAAQDAGQGTVLGMSLNLMGVPGAQTDPGMAAAGLQAGAFGNENVPGSPMNAKKVIMSGTDLAGEQWARPHHAESSWKVYKDLTGAGLDWKTSMVLSGDDAISGSGRLNGFNNQDGKDGFNDDEAAVFRMAAVVQRSTGIRALDIVAGGHSHTGIDDSAKTKPNINKLIGLKHGDTSGSPQRMALIEKALLDGTIKGGNAKKFAVDAKGAYKGAGGNSQVLQYAISQVAGAKGGEKVDVLKNVFKGTNAVKTPSAEGGGASAGAKNAEIPTSPVGGGCSADPSTGASLIGGGPSNDLLAVLNQLTALLQQLASLLQGMGATSVPTAPPATAAAAAPAAAAATHQH